MLFLSFIYLKVNFGQCQLLAFERGEEEHEKYIFPLIMASLNCACNISIPTNLCKFFSSSQGY